VSRAAKAGMAVAAAVIAAGLVIGLVGLGHALRPHPTPATLAPTTLAPTTLAPTTSAAAAKSKGADPATLCLRLFDASDAAPADPAAIRKLAAPALATELLRADATRPPHFRGPAAKVFTEQTGTDTAVILGPDFELVCTVAHGRVVALGAPK